MKEAVTVNSRGVVTLPATLREAMGLKADGQLIAETTPEGLLLRPAVTLPVEIYTPEREREFDAAEAELAEVLSPRKAAPQRRRSSKPSRRVRAAASGASAAEMRVLLDANVLFSAAKTDGAMRLLPRLLKERGHECWVDAYVVAEARRNLVANGPQALAVLDALLPHLNVAPALSTAVATEQVDWLPQKDRPVLAAAIRLGGDALVTGDRTHFRRGYSWTFGGRRGPLAAVAGRMAAALLSKERHRPRPTALDLPKPNRAAADSGGWGAARVRS